MNPCVIRNHSSNHLISETTFYPLTLNQKLRTSSSHVTSAKTFQIIQAHIYVFLQGVHLYFPMSIIS